MFILPCCTPLYHTSLEWVSLISHTNIIPLARMETRRMTTTWVRSETKPIQPTERPTDWLCGWSAWQQRLRYYCTSVRRAWKNRTELTTRRRRAADRFLFYFDDSASHSLSSRGGGDDDVHDAAAAAALVSAVGKLRRNRIRYQFSADLGKEKKKRSKFAEHVSLSCRLFNYYCSEQCHLKYWL